MSSRTPTVEEDADAVAARGALRLARGITATWWYTFSALIFFELMVIALWVLALFAAADVTSTRSIVVVGIGGLVWAASTAILLRDYRRRAESTPVASWRRVLAPLVIAVVYGATAGAVTGIWVIAAVPLAQSVVLLNWPPGVRARVVLVTTALLIALAVVDVRVVFAEGGALAGADWGFVGVYTCLLPAMTVSSLWWWDVLVTLDRARASEARLAATQERLRVATDVHDLQGHHLQVIALQLELAERLMSRDPDAALEQLRASRASVDEARQGTRDLALRFRSVPLADELANAVDLMRAAGTTADAVFDVDANSAPGGVLGPVVRETTTNVLRHGGGKWARLSLTRAGSQWRYEISNDAANDSQEREGGSGIDGLRRRAAEAGGTLDVRREKHEFTLTMTIPGEKDENG